MIKLQDLTPAIYYQQSRDFQFIGRLYDIVLNSVKTNAEMLYNIPLNDNTDERLVDLMTLTLGFKSKHNYNVKQLTSLCSAFTEVIRNKGNIKGIFEAGQALLNAEGVSEEIRYTFDVDENEKQLPIINIFIPEELTDVNLFRDLLVYILPAGMSCNLIRELRVHTEATTNLGITDSVVIYNGTYYDDNGRTHVPVDVNRLSIVPEIGQNGLTNPLARNTAGIFVNSGVYQPVIPGDVSEQYIPNFKKYSITYITNGGKITDPNVFEYEVGTGLNELPEPTKEGYDFDRWEDESGTEVSNIGENETGNKILFAKWTKNTGE